MFSQVHSATIIGSQAKMVSVEADISNGFPSYAMVGYLGSEVREARERVLTAIKNAGIQIPACKMIINMAPADLRKSGTGFDLAIAVAILAALGKIPATLLNETFFAGELSLDGSIRPIHGILTMAYLAKEMGMVRCVLPKMNAKEAANVKELDVYGVNSLEELLAWLRGNKEIEKEEVHNINKLPVFKRDFGEIYGQEHMKSAIEVAVSGGHHLLIIGAPGSGKSMASLCLDSIMPKMTHREQIEVTKIHSIAGDTLLEDGLIYQRPIRSPHHSISASALIGGGTIPVPGEISLASKGILFLDEFAEFRKETIEMLRQPLEERKIRIHRIHGRYEFPGDFTLFAAMNPCPCGFYPNRQKCQCSYKEIHRYLSHISMAILDRFDMGIEVLPVELEKIASYQKGKTSKEMKDAIEKARQVQYERFGSDEGKLNGMMTPGEIKKYCQLTKAAMEILSFAYKKQNMSARGYHKILKTARTIADMEQQEKIDEIHVVQALSYRSIEERYWLGGDL